MPDSLQQEIFDQIYFFMRTGFYETEDVLLGIEGAFYDEEIDVKWVKQQINQAYEEQEQLQKKFPKVTDFDKLAYIFDQLNSAGIIALHKPGYTRQDGERDCQELHEELKKINIKTTGYCFYHTQDVDRAIEGGNLFIAFGDFNNDDNVATAIGHLIANRLREEGFTLNWDSTAHTRIEIVPFKWQKRLGNKNCSKERAIMQLSAQR